MVRSSLSLVWLFVVTMLSCIPVVFGVETIMCATNWEHYKGACYFVGWGVLDIAYADAQNACQTDGADVTSILDPAEESFILGLLAVAGATDVWIGLNDMATDGTYVWQDGETVAYLNWDTDANQPTTVDDNEDCTVLLDELHYVWHDAPCDLASVKGYICKIKIDTILTNKSASQSSTYMGNDANRAIDGNTEQNLNSASCTHTETNDGTWWKVDLETSMCISSITIYNRNDAVPERLEGAEVRVGDTNDVTNTQCASGSPITGVVADLDQIFDVTCNLNGRYLTVGHPSGTPNVLTLCEVKAISCDKVTTESAITTEQETMRTTMDTTTMESSTRTTSHIITTVGRTSLTAMEPSATVIDVTATTMDDHSNTTLTRTTIKPFFQNGTRLLLSTFEKFASTFPANATPGVIANNNGLGFYLFEQGTLKEDFQFDGENDMTVTVPKGFLKSGFDDKTGFLTVVILNTPNDDTQYQGDDSDIVYLLASPLVSVNLFDRSENLLKSENEQHPLTIAFPIQNPRNTSIQIDNSKYVCAFWDTENSLWSQKGSYKVDTNGALQTCEFNHVTTFAVLFEFSKGVANAYSHVVETVVKLGIGVSLLALAAGLVIYAIIWKRTTLDKEKILIHANLMTAMVFAYVLTFASKGAKSNQIVCLVVTILRYNMFLVVFCCMFVEALHLYRLILGVFGTQRNFRVAYIVISWGVPLLLSIITAAVGRENVHDQERCWLSGQFIWAFIAPAVAILTINLVLLSVIVYKTQVAARLDEDKTHSIRIGLRCAVLLLPMVGVTWLIGLLGNFNINVVYVFDILSSLQGLYLVIVICYVNSEVRDALKRELNRRTGRVEEKTVRSVNGRPADELQDTTDD